MKKRRNRHSLEPFVQQLDERGGCRTFHDARLGEIGERVDLLLSDHLRNLRLIGFTCKAVESLQPFAVT